MYDTLIKLNSIKELYSFVDILNNHSGTFEIVANDYDLSINKYKKVEYIAEEYPSPLEIMTNLNELEMQITSGLAELEEML